MQKLFTFVFLSLFVLLSFSSYAQVVVENFDYTASSFLTDNGYTAHSGGTTNAITVNSGNLTYPGYPASGIGNHIQLLNTGQDVHKTLATDITSGTIYASLLVNVDSARVLGEYFFHLSPNPISTTFRSRLFVKLASNGNLAFGLSKGSTSTTVPPIYTDSIYSAGTTYLVVVGYEIVDGTNNDIAKLWVNPVVSATEPPALLTVTDPTQADINVGSYAFRQGTSAAGAYLKLDGMIIDTSWISVIPVELTSFSADVNIRNVNITWTTASEINNSGFSLERKSANSEWQSIVFISGNGTTTQAQQYSYIDKNLTDGKYNYRLKQIDFDGSFEYSKTVEVLISAPSKFELAQNYPNPFNPSTSITFTLPQSGNVKLSVYNLLGQEVQNLVSGFIEAGSHTINFNAKNLNSGIYLYKLEANGFTQTRKMTLIK